MVGVVGEPQEDEPPGFSGRGSATVTDQEPRVAGATVVRVSHSSRLLPVQPSKGQALSLMAATRESQRAVGASQMRPPAQDQDDLSPP